MIKKTKAMNKRPCRVCGEPGANAKTTLCCSCEKEADAMFEQAINRLISAGHVMTMKSKGQTSYRLTPAGEAAKQAEKDQP